MKLKSTPGPWMYMLERQEVEKDFVLLFHTVRDGNKNIVRVPNEPDARLIAAAPDMIEALIGIYHSLCDDTGIDIDAEKVEKIIERATGMTIDEIMKEGEWIGCTDRLPDNDGLFYVYFGKRNEYYSEYETMWYNSDNYDWSYKGMIAPTHWMPLPDPPEVKP